MMTAFALRCEIRKEQSAATNNPGSANQCGAYFFFLSFFFLLFIFLHFGNYVKKNL